MSIIGWILFGFTLGVINFAISMSRIKVFLTQHQMIDSQRTLEKFKKMVKKQMFQALLQIAFIGFMGVLAVYGIWSHKLSNGEFLLSLLLNGIIFGLGKMGKSTEDKSRSLIVEDRSLEEQYRTVCRSWVHDPLPNF